MSEPKPKSLKRIMSSQILNETLLNLEKEKFQLLKKLKNYEDKYSQNETEKRRILKRQEGYKENLKAMENKIKEYRSKRKDLQKNIIHIIQFFSKTMNKINTYSNQVLGSVGKMMQSLALGQKYDFSEIMIFNPLKQIDDLFDYINTLKIEKIDFVKVKKSVKKRTQDSNKGKEKTKSLNSMYNGLLSRFKFMSKDLSRDDFNEILDQFETHKQLLIENSGLLNKRSLNDSHDLNSHSFLDSSLNQSAMSSILEANSLRKGILSLNKTFNLQESLKEDNKELLLLCEELEDQKEDVDLKLKLANKRSSKLKKEVDNIKKILELKKDNLKNVEKEGKKFEDEFEEILTQLEGINIKINFFLGLESEEYQCNHYGKLLNSGIEKAKKEVKIKLNFSVNNILSSSGISVSSNKNLYLKENLSP